MNIVTLTKQLIEIESITGNEQNITGFVASYLEKIGFQVDLQEVNQGRQNIYARKGEPLIVISTHLDTVAPYIHYREEEKFIFGRGACDTKGIMAAQILAAERLLSEGVSDFGLLFVVGEEGPSDGAIAANTLINRCQFLINGEPTDNMLASGSKGSLHVKLSATGKSAHSAYPEQGESAIWKLLDVLNDIRSYAFPNHSLLGETTVNVGVISGGIQGNIIPPTAEAQIMCRVVTNVAEIKRIMEKIVNERVNIDFGLSNEPVFMETPEGFETTTVSFTTDIPKLSNWGRPLLFGPGSILDAHTDHEKINKSEQNEAVELYYKLAKQLMKKATGG